jgi:hypothetical protein
MSGMGFLTMRAIAVPAREEPGSGLAFGFARLLKTMLLNVRVFR